MNSEEACDAHASLLPASFKPLLSLTCAKAATSVAVLSACFSYITSAYPTVTGGTKSRPTSKVRIHPPESDSGPVLNADAILYPNFWVQILRGATCVKYYVARHNNIQATFWESSSRAFSWKF